MKCASAGMLFMLAVVGWSSTEERQSPVRTPIAKAGNVKEDEWGTIRGQVLFAGASLPKAKQLDVNKDQMHCLEKGPLFDEEFVVNPASKGVQYAVVFLKPPKGETLPIHPSLKEPNPKEAVPLRFRI